MNITRKEDKFYHNEELITPKKICGLIRSGKLIRFTDSSGNDISTEILAELAFESKKDIFGKLARLLDRDFFEELIENGGVDEFLARKARGFYD